MKIRFYDKRVFRVELSSQGSITGNPSFCVRKGSMAVDDTSKGWASLKSFKIIPIDNYFHLVLTTFQLRQ